MPIFPIFSAKHRLWVPTVYGLSKKEKQKEKYQNFSTENCHFFTFEKILYIAWASFCNVLQMQEQIFS